MEKYLYYEQYVNSARPFIPVARFCNFLFSLLTTSLPASRHNKSLGVKALKLKPVLLGIFALLSLKGFSANISSIASGNWNSPLIWSTLTVPTAADNVTIANGTTVTINANATCTNLTVGGGTSGILYIGNSTTARTLTLNGSLIVKTGAIFEPNPSFAATHTIICAGSITNGGTMNMLPTATSLCNVTMNSTANRTLGGTASISFNNLSINTTKIVSLGSNETIDGTLTIALGTLDVSTASYALKVGGDFINNGVFRQRSGTVTLAGTGTSQNMGGSTVTAFFNLTIAGGASDVISLANNITIGGAFTISSGTFDVTGNDYAMTVNGNFTNNASSSAFVARKGKVTFGGTSTVGGTASTVFNDITISSLKTVTLANNETVQDTLTITGTLNITTFNLTIGSAFIDNGTFSTSGGNVTFTGNTTSPLNISGTAGTITFDTLNISTTNTTDIVYLNHAITVNSNLAIKQGTLHCKTFQVTGNAAGKISMAAGTTLVLGLTSSATSVLFPSAFTAANISLNSTSTVIYQANVATQRISVVPAYGNLTIYTGASSVTKTPSAAGTLTATGNLTVGDGVGAGKITFSMTTNTLNVTGNATVNSNGLLTFSSGICNLTGSLTNNGTVAYSAAGALNIGGNFTNNSTFTAGTSTATFNGISTQTIGGTAITSFYLLTINGTNVVLGNSETATSNLLISSGTLNAGSSGYTLKAGGNFTNNATFTAGNSTVIMNGAAAQTIGGTTATTFYNLTSNGATVTLGNNQTVSNNLLISTGTLNVSASNYSLTVGGNFTNNAAFNADNGTVTFNGAAAQTIGGTTATTFYNLTLNGATVTLGNAETAGNTLLISSGTLDVSTSNYGLTVGGAFTNNAAFNAESGTVTMNGIVTQSIGGTSGTTFYNLTLSGKTITLNHNEILTSVLTVNTGALNGPDSLTMVSNITRTARIAAVGATASIGANFIMQRYVTGTTANYQALSSPSKASILKDWDYDAGFYMSGVGGNDGNAISAGKIYYSVKTYNEATSKWDSVATDNYALTPGLGLYLWMGNSLSTFSPFTFDTRGIPNYGNVNYGVTKNSSGSNLIGNPYESPISWTAFQGANAAVIGATFYVFDETTGNWESSNGTTGSGGRIATNPNIIPAHQGFMVAASTTGTVTFKESQKISTDAVVIRPIKPFLEDLVRITLTENNNTYSGHTLVQFENGATEEYRQGEDALYIKSLTEGAPVIYTESKDSALLIWDKLPAVSEKNGKERDIVVYGGGTAGTYTMTFDGIDKLTKYNCVQLEDIKRGKRVGIQAGGSYSYEVSGDVEMDKFIVHFKELGPGENCDIPEAQKVTTDINSGVDVISYSAGAMVRFALPLAEDVTISAYNMLGQKIGNDIRTNISTGEVNVPLSSSGIYIIKIQMPEGTLDKRVFHGS